MKNVSQHSNKWKGKSYIFLHLLITIFGTSTWIGINGIYAQLPVLINTSPEGWTLPVYLVLIIQAANIGPLFYMLLQRLQCKINESWWILCLLVLGTCAMGLLIFFYSEKIVSNGADHSVVLFILTFFNALVGCSSSVLFMPYLHNFNESYLVSFFIGEGLSGVLPSIVALIQGVENNSECINFKNDTTNSSNLGLKFSPNNYFLFIFIILLLSLTAFIILEYSLFVQNIKNLDKSINNETQINFSNYTNDVQNIKTSSFKENNKEWVLCNNSKGLSKQIQHYLFILLAICYFCSNGFFPSIQSYSCLSYGNIAYKLSVTFSQFANPLVCLLAYRFRISSIKVINYLSIVCLIIGTYVTYLALMSPTPPLQKTKLGIFMIVMSWTGLIGFISYLKFSIVSIFRSTMLPKILFSVGAVIQMASTSGAIFSFIAINCTDYFKMHDNCVLESN